MFFGCGVLAASGLVILHRSRRVAGLFTTLVILGIWGTLGQRAPFDLYAVCHHLLPGFKMNLHTTRFFILAYLGVPFLVALGATAVEQIVTRWFPHRWVTMGMVALVGWGAITAGGLAWAQLRHHQYGQIAPVALGFRGALVQPAKVMLSADGAIHVWARMMNVGDTVWDRRLRWELSLAGQRCALEAASGDVTPGSSAVLSGVARAPQPAGRHPLTLGLYGDTGGHCGQILLATISCDGRGQVHVAERHPGFIDAAHLEACLTTPLPPLIRAWLATLAMVEGHHTWRTYSAHADVYPLTAWYDRFDVLNYQNDGIRPKYHYHPEHNLNIADPERTWKLFRILNVRYLAFDPSTAFVDPLQTRLVWMTNWARLYEIPTALPRVWIPQRTALLIGEDRDHDGNALEARVLLYHAAWDPAVWAIFQSPRAVADEHVLDDLAPFSAVVLTRPIVHDARRAEALLTAYRQQGGRVIHASYVDHPYPNPVTAQLSLLGGVNPETTFVDHPVPTKVLTPPSDEAIEALMSSCPPSTPRPSVVVQRQEPGVWQLGLFVDQPVTPLVVSETYYPGWEARVDGRPTPLFMVDGLIRGILVHGRGSPTR